MALDPVDPNPAFPHELEQEIFETTALMYPREIPTLLRVARRVLIWIEPLLYRIIRAKGATLHGLPYAIKSKPPDFFHKVVRHLCLHSIVKEQEARQVLDVCTGLVGLVLNQSYPTFLPILANMRLQRLSTSIHPLFRGAPHIDLKHPLFALLTHLDLLDSHQEHLAQILPQIPTLHKLTHLALNYGVSRDLVETLLVDCPRLELLLSLYISEGRYELARIPHVYDVRFVIGMRPDDYWGDWEAGAKGLPHLWSLADDFVARKRSGAIEGTSLLLT